MSKRTTTLRPVDPSHVEIRAYFAWLNRGGAHGGDVSDWLAAEAAQRRSDAARQGAATRARKADEVAGCEPPPRYRASLSAPAMH